MTPSFKLRILHLEDEMSLCDIVRTTVMVLDRNTEVHQFQASNDAWVFAQEHGKSIDLFLLDVRVPGEVDGIGFARRLREMGCNGLLAFTSAYAAPDTQTVAKLDYLWLTKPVELNRMRSTLKLARARAETLAQNGEKLESTKQAEAEEITESRKVTKELPPETKQKTKGEGLEKSSAP